MPKGRVLVFDGPDTQTTNSFFEVPDDVVAQVYAMNPAATFVENLRAVLEQADRYLDLCES